MKNNRNDNNLNCILKAIKQKENTVSKKRLSEQKKYINVGEVNVRHCIKILSSLILKKNFT